MVFFPFSGALFTAQFSHLWIDYSSMGVDKPAKFLGSSDGSGAGSPSTVRAQVDWWENSRRHSVMHRARCAAAASTVPTFAAGGWGVTASDVPSGYGVYGVYPKPIAPTWQRPEWDYSTFRGKDDLGDGTIAPYGAGSSIMFEPVQAVEALRTYKALATKAPKLWQDPAAGGFGFADAFKVNADGTIWVAQDHLAIDQGPLMLAIENARTGLIWRLFHEHQSAKSGMRKLGLKRAK